MRGFGISIFVFKRTFLCVVYINKEERKKIKKNPTHLKLPALLGNWQHLEMHKQYNNTQRVSRHKTSMDKHQEFMTIPDTHIIQE